MKAFNSASLLAASVLTAVFVCSGAQAATQGTAGTTSTGVVNVSATISARVDITNLSDITFADADLGPVVNTSNQATKASNVCVWSNNSDKSYYITASGSGSSSAFTLANSTNPVIPYEVYWAQTTGQTTGTQLTTATKSAKLTSNATSPTCGGSTSASLVVGIQGSDANTMLAATNYTGTLTLLVSPN
jgi:hypothetical protein